MSPISPDEVWQQQIPLWGLAVQLALPMIRRGDIEFALF
jgi:hypothetical protein